MPTSPRCASLEEKASLYSESTWAAGAPLEVAKSCSGWQWTSPGVPGTDWSKTSLTHSGWFAQVVSQFPDCPHPSWIAGKKDINQPPSKSKANPKFTGCGQWWDAEKETNGIICSWWELGQGSGNARTRGFHPVLISVCWFLHLQHLAGWWKHWDTADAAAGDARAALSALLRWQFASGGKLRVSCDGFSSGRWINNSLLWTAQGQNSPEQEWWPRSTVKFLI